MASRGRLARLSPTGAALLAYLLSPRGEEYPPTLGEFILKTGTPRSSAYDARRELLDLGLVKAPPSSPHSTHNTTRIAVSIVPPPKGTKWTSTPQA